MTEAAIQAGIWVDKAEMEVVLALRDQTTNCEVRVRAGPGKMRELIAILEAACKQLEDVQ